MALSVCSRSCQFDWRYLRPAAICSHAGFGRISSTFWGRLYAVCHLSEAWSSIDQEFVSDGRVE